MPISSPAKGSTVHSSFPKSASDHFWSASGKPIAQPTVRSEHSTAATWPVLDASFDCATCGVPSARGIALKNVLNPTFSRHADFLKFGDHVCEACAWMYAEPKLRHRNVVAIGDVIAWPMIGVASATVDRPHWSVAWSAIVRAPSGTPLSGVLTTDPKPRLWPLARVSTVDRPGLYVHVPDYDVSAYVEFDRVEVASMLTTIGWALDRGFSKRAVYYGLTRDLKRCAVDMTSALVLDREIAAIRPQSGFLVALMIARAA
jgi:hypothetical protein